MRDTNDVIVQHSVVVTPSNKHISLRPPMVIPNYIAPGLINDGFMQGIWYTAIYDPKSGAMVKCDECDVRHDLQKEDLWGHIVRIFPEEEKGKEWDFFGKCVVSNVSLVFWTIDKLDNASSMGCANLKYISDILWKGEYFRPVQGRGPDGTQTGNTHIYEVDWLRKNPTLK